jgi:hypothetical protein
MNVTRPTKDTRLTYSEEELRSYLPLGWEYTGASDWDEKRGVLTLTILDDVDFDWPVHVSAKEAADEAGRLGALRNAIDRVYRDRLGKHTRGLGRAG